MARLPTTVNGVLTLVLAVPCRSGLENDPSGTATDDDVTLEESSSTSAPAMDSGITSRDAFAAADASASGRRTGGSIAVLEVVARGRGAGEADDARSSSARPESADMVGLTRADSGSRRAEADMDVKGRGALMGAIALLAADFCAKCVRDRSELVETDAVELGRRKYRARLHLYEEITTLIYTAFLKLRNCTYAIAFMFILARYEVCHALKIRALGKISIC